MKLAYRGVVDRDGTVVGWPMLLLDHAQAFAVLHHLSDYQARWRQWEPDGRVDIDPGGEEHREAIEAWVEAVQS